MVLARIVAPHFVAGLEADGVVVRAAPIIRYMMGWSGRELRDFCFRKNWKWEVVPT